jgi:AcrR family transcriptional regulator
LALEPGFRALINKLSAQHLFGSKQGLFQAVVDRAMGPVNDERRRRLDAIEARNQRASVADLVRAFVEPGLELTGRHGERGAAVARFIGRVICDPDLRIRRLFAVQVDPVESSQSGPGRRTIGGPARAVPGPHGGTVGHLGPAPVVQRRQS